MQPLAMRTGQKTPGACRTQHSHPRSLITRPMLPMAREPQSQRARACVLPGMVKRWLDSNVALLSEFSADRSCSCWPNCFC